jgi:tetratricopeptide (TPR) repeat protein
MATIVAERGLALLHAGRYADARPLCEQAAALLNWPGELPERVAFLWFTDLTYLATGDYSAIRLGPDLRDEDRTDLDQTEWRYSVHLSWAILDLLRGDWEEAEQNLHIYADNMQAVARLDMVGGPLALLALTAYRRGDYAVSQQRVMQAMESAVRQGYFLAQCMSLGVLALFLAEAGDLEGAVELYATATVHPGAGNARWFHDILGAPIARLAEALPDDVRQAAEAHGRARDPEAAAREILAKLRTAAS